MYSFLFATFQNLEANQTYFYQVSCEYGHHVFKSDIFMFKTLSNDKVRFSSYKLYSFFCVKISHKT